MSKLVIPESYSSALTLRETQHAIKYVKDTFQKALAFAVTLDRVTAPLIVTKNSGINDDLNGVERKVDFDIKLDGSEAEVVQSLAKWKRMALYRYSYGVGEGIYTDMNAIRRDDDMDNIHSIYVDQWDWEKVISKNQRTVDYLKETVKSIVKAIVYTKRQVRMRYPALNSKICEEPYFVTTEELLKKYPKLSPKERERAIAQEKKTVFLMQIGKVLSNGERHDGRAPDYDDWELNGDIIFWDDIIDDSIEISSMGIRVDADSLKKQLEESGTQDRMKYDYHKMIADGTLPLTIGGGIGQSRLCMFLLEKAHIGEVQNSVWPEEMVKICKRNGINFL